MSTVAIPERVQRKWAAENAQDAHDAQVAQAKAEQDAIDRLDVATNLRSLTEAYLAQRAEVERLLPEFSLALANTAGLRTEYLACHAKAIRFALDVEVRIPPLDGRTYNELLTLASRA
jgi:hypothetical protein